MTLLLTLLPISALFCFAAVAVTVGEF